MDMAVSQIQDVIADNSQYRDIFIQKIQWYLEKYKDDEVVSYILAYVLQELSITQPNILLIIADDMGLDSTPWYDEWTVKPSMPHLETMMDKWIRYTNLWSAPVCTPTRATIMTGKYWYHTNMLAVDDTLDASEVSLPSYLDEITNSTYSHAVIGKWHIGSAQWHPESIGVWYYAGMQTWWAKAYDDWRFVENAQTTKSNEYITSKFTDLAIDWVEEQDAPWFLWLAYTAPHTPFHLPPDDLHEQWVLEDDEESISRNSLPYYMAAIEAMDSEIWRLLESMSAQERENTVIIFIWDNWTPWKVVQNPYERKKAKGSLYQWWINVPMVVSWYWVDRQGEVEDMLVNTTDLYATIASIAGGNNIDIKNSFSIMESFWDENSDSRDYIYSELWWKGYTLRDGTHKIIVSESDEQELYNLISDPYEFTNLLDDGVSSSEQLILERLMEHIEDARK